MSDSFELVRTKSGDELAAVVETLTAAGVPHRVAGTRAGFDITEVGRGDYPADMLVMVPWTEVKAARAALEASFAETELPGDHFLHSSTDEELLEILAVPLEWDPFVVVHARRLAAGRGLQPAATEAKAAEVMEALSLGKPAARWQVILGWVSVLLGGLVGILIGASLAFSKERHPEGEYPTYDARTRQMGEWMIWCGVGMLVVWRFAVMTR